MTDLENDRASVELTRISQLVNEAGPDPRSAALSEAAQELGQLLMPYRFGLEEMLTKINILREELSFRPASAASSPRRRSPTRSSTSPGSGSSAASSRTPTGCSRC